MKILMGVSDKYLENGGADDWFRKASIEEEIRSLSKKGNVSFVLKK